MLVLSRKPGEKIIIGDGIELMVVGISGNRVKLGIAAPERCRILRAECCREGHGIREEAKPAAAARAQAMAGCGV